jgi:gamma-glutamylaminecyclotransferase
MGRHTWQLCTCDPYPLVVAGPWYAPMMFDQPGTGEITYGELYEVDASILSRIDQLESIGVPGNSRLTHVCARRMVAQSC